MSSGSEEEMDYDQAVEKLVNMFPHINKQRIIHELGEAGNIEIIIR